ncbi:hypothetical protein bcgnr5378_29570 [Bacillus cereus]|uniref:Group-specific protein n=1 Tax=Bacillus cereus TaxID=1396 RepID=A0A162PIS8_BACCE|nr:hypothetical protein [Bacillus cereus]KZD72155.1 hypothetical protein B4088_0616 [Bacillus cereus]
MAKYLISALSLLLSFMFIANATVYILCDHFSYSASSPITNNNFEQTDFVPDNIEDIIISNLSTIFLNDDLENVDLPPGFLLELCLEFDINVYLLN